MEIIDATGELNACFASGTFDLDRWGAYIDAAVPGARELCLGDLRDCLDADFTWEGSYLPVLNAVLREREKREWAIASFHAVTERLDKRLLARFGRTVDAKVILYLGLCNGAGWVTTVRGQRAVLLGLEKILELDWCGIDDMTGLILHELGHVYQGQYGVLYWETDDEPEQFLRQLFTEGVAMVFEQELVGDPTYFHQDRDGWKNWCDRNAAKIRRSFEQDRNSMTRMTQRYFGDWVSFEGHGDTGYYIGTRFVRFLMETEDFDRIIQYDMEEVKAGYARFLAVDL